MARIRTFIAVDLIPVVRNRVVDLQHDLQEAGADVKWVEEENLHVSLLFLGEVDEREVYKVCRAVAEVCAGHDAFVLRVEGVGCFPNPRRPRVAFAGITDGATELTALHAALEPPLMDLGCYRREERAFTPHVTLGRVRGERTSGELGPLLLRRRDWHGGEQPVREVHVFSSELTPKGPVYAVLSRARLRQEK
jgi:RNA 2',3'-cyclic 3'-phosphodiesterase